MMDGQPMTTSDNATQSYCPNCIKFGFPILPVRYAVANNAAEVEKKAPALNAPFGLGVQDIALAEESAIYTLRLLRNGYLYVFNEVRSQWKAYQVDSVADLTEFDIEDSPPPQDNTAQAVCSRHGTQILAKCIIVPDAKQAGALWLAFSANPWTPAVIRNHRRQTYRERHMRRIDVGAWARSASAQPHMDSLYRTVDQVAEFHLAEDYQVPPAEAGGASSTDGSGTITLPTITVTASSLEPFDSSLSDYVSLTKMDRDILRSQTQQAARQSKPDDPAGVTPAIVALDDALGIAADLNQLALDHLMAWAEEPERKEMHETALAITALKEAIQNGAVESEELGRKNTAIAQHTAARLLFGRTAVDALSVPVQEWDDDWFKVEDEDEVMRLGEESWKKYRKHLRGNEYQVYLEQTYPQELAAYARRMVEPLDQAFLKWIEDAKFKQHLICNYDPVDVDSGVHYQESLASVIQDALQRQSILEHIQRCLENDDPADPQAVWMRAFAWNQDAAIAKWKSIAAQQKEPELNWDGFGANLFNAWKEILNAGVDGKLEGAFSNLAKYVFNLSAPLTRMVGKVSKTLVSGGVMLTPHKLQMGLFGALAKVDNPQLQIIDLVGQTTAKRARNALAAQIAGQAGILEAQATRSAARDVLNRGGAPSGQGLLSFGMVVLADQNGINVMRALNLNGSWARSVRNRVIPQVYSAVQFKAVLRQSIGKVGSMAFGTGVVSLILAGGSLGQLNEEYAKATAGAKALKAVNFAAGIAGVLGGGAETVGALGNRLPWTSQKLATPMGRWMFNASTRAEVVMAGGRWLSGIAGVVVGVLAIYEGASDLKLNRTYGILMVAGGLASIVSAVMILSGALMPIAVLLMILAAIVTVVVAWFKPDEIERWLDKAMHFGKNSADEFSDLESQAAAIENFGSV